MDTVDKVEDVVAKKKPGRPKRADAATPMGSYIAEQAKQARKKNQVVEKYYEMRGEKLSLCKRMAGGTVFKTLVGTTSDKVSGKQVLEFVKKLDAEGKLRKKV